MEEEMEVEMEMEVEVFQVLEVDLDYEFEASRYFDFTREETEEEVYEAEIWFRTAKSYPPSPFVVEMFSVEKILSESINVSPKLKCSDYQEQIQQDETFKGHYQGFAFYDHISKDVKKLKTKPSIKPYVPRSSTLMKPTASQIARQNSRIHVGDSRFQKQHTNFNVPSGAEIPAAKRQKLDGGQLRKIGDVNQVNNLVHKVPKKDVNVPGVSHNRMKITIPVDPDLATGNRTPRLLSTARDGAAGKTTFKARPLNRKILEGPTLPLSKKSTARLPEFEVFHLKTMERAKQHTEAARPTLLHQPHKEFTKPGVGHVMYSRSKSGSSLKAVDTHDEDIHKAGNGFKARPLNKKIFASKGGMGVFRHNQQAVTIPKEFNFQTNKRHQHNPLSELFGKLSIKSEDQLKSSATPKLTRPNCIPSKGSKENRGGILQQGHNMNR